MANALTWPVSDRPPHFSSRAAPVGSMQTALVSGGTYASEFGLPLSTNGSGLTNLYPGTGLGINGINSILTQSNLGVEAAIDPATQWNLALAQRLLRIGSGFSRGGGYYLLSGGGAYAVPAESVESDQPVASSNRNPKVIVLQQAPAQQARRKPRRSQLPRRCRTSANSRSILQDGRQIQAVAFTHMNDRIIYITNDGSRRTIALSDLDTDATLRINRGTRHASSTSPLIICSDIGLLQLDRRTGSGM